MITVQLISVIEIIFWAVNLVSLHYPFILFYQTASLSLKLHIILHRLQTVLTTPPVHIQHTDCRGLPYPEPHGEMFAPCLSARHCPPSSWHLRFTTSPVLSEGTEGGWRYVPGTAQHFGNCSITGLWWKWRIESSLLKSLDPATPVMAGSSPDL